MSIEAMKSKAEAISQAASLIAKLGLFFGSVSLVSYLMRIDHLPREMSIGDGILLLIVAASTGIVYSLFTVSLVSLGVTIVAPFRKLLARFIGILSPQMGGRLEIKLARFDLSGLPFAGLALLFIFAAAREDATALWQLPLIAVGTYFVYSVLTHAQREKAKLVSERSSLLVAPTDGASTDSASEDRHTRSIALSVLFLAAAPLATGIANGTLLDGSMRLAQIRVENVTMHVKRPHHSLFPASLSAPSVYTPNGFKTFKGVDILFRGFGTTVVVALPEGDEQRLIEIPSESLLIEHHRPGKHQARHLAQ
jgi:hypothetical protein